MTISKTQQNISSGWKLKKMSDILDYERPDNYIVKNSSYSNKAKTPVLTANKSFILGYTDEDFGIYENIPAIIFDDFTTDSKYVDFPFKIKSSAIKILKPKDENINLRFVYEKMKLIKFPISNHKRYYISQYQNQDILLPPIKEQQKIAEILGTVDEDIAKTQGVIEATEKLKRGLMQQLFTRGVDDGISELELGKISKVTSSKRIMRSEYIGQGVPFYRSKEIIEKAKGIKHDSIFYISKERFNEIERKFCAPHIGDILITAVGTIGVVYLVDEEGFYFKDGNLLWIKDVDESLDKSYLRHYMNSKIFQKRVLGTAIGSNQKALTIEKIEKVIVPIPKLPEQQKIAEILSDVDEKISVNKKLKEKLTLLKKGLMQDLLSGRVRTIV